MGVLVAVAVAVGVGVGSGVVKICSEAASFMDTHVTVGLVAAMEPVGLTRRIPLKAILRMAFLGNQERMTPQRAYDIGMVQEVVPAAQLHETARWVAERIASQPATAVQTTVRAIWYASQMGSSHALKTL